MPIVVSIGALLAIMLLEFVRQKRRNRVLTQESTYKYLQWLDAKKVRFFDNSLLSVFACVHEMYDCINMCVYGRECRCVCIYICMYIYIQVYVHVYIHIYTYVYTHVYTYAYRHV